MGKKKQKGSGKKASVFRVNGSKVEKAKKKNKQVQNPAKQSNKAAKMKVDQVNVMFADMHDVMALPACKEGQKQNSNKTKKISKKIVSEGPVNVDVALQDFSKL